MGQHRVVDGHVTRLGKPCDLHQQLADAFQPAIQFRNARPLVVELLRETFEMDLQQAVVLNGTQTVLARNTFVRRTQDGSDYPQSILQRHEVFNGNRADDRTTDSATLLERLLRPSQQPLLAPRLLRFHVRFRAGGAAVLMDCPRP